MTDLNQYLTDERVDAATRAYGYGDFEDAARASLEAVLPGIVQAAKVEALRDAAADIDLEDAAKASDISDLDYDWSGHYWEAVAEGWLHRRTDQIEKGGQQ